jgi:hypothetical protein
MLEADIISALSAQGDVVVLRQVDKRHQTWVLIAIGVSVAATIGISAATGKAEHSPECVQLARIVAGRQHSMLDSQRFRDTEQKAYDLCVAEPAVFRKLIRVD